MSGCFIGIFIERHRPTFRWRTINNAVAAADIRRDNSCAFSVSYPRTSSTFAVGGNMRRTLHCSAKYCRILHVDNNLLVAYKDANVLSVPGRTELALTRNAYKHCNDWMLQQCSQQRCQVASILSLDHEPPPHNAADALHILHRLDAATSGLILFPTNPASLSALARQLESRSMMKGYEAIVDTRFLSAHSPLWSAAVGSSGSVTTPLGANAHVPLLQQTALDQQQGGDQIKYGLLRPCHTDWTILEIGDGAMRLRLRPHTGRTHQLRLHCALAPPDGLGAPILGDHMYGDPQLAAHSYLHELVHRYRGQTGGIGPDAAAGVAARLLAQAQARAAGKPTAGQQTEQGIALPYLASSPYLNGSSFAITGADPRVPRLLLHACSLTLPDAFLPARARQEDWARVERGWSKVAALDKGQQQLLFSIPASESVEAESRRYTLCPPDPLHTAPPFEKVAVLDVRGAGTRTEAVGEGQGAGLTGQDMLFTIEQGQGQLQHGWRMKQRVHATLVSPVPPVPVRTVTLTARTPF